MNKSDLSKQYLWINNRSELTELCDYLSQQTAIAVDTEFVRTNTYYPHFGLLQLACQEQIYLVDPLTLSTKQPLIDLLQNTSVVKVIHSCSEDLEVFHHVFGVFPEPLFDTQVAAAFAGYGMSIGYANLLKAMKNIDIPKAETCSDWLQRPLTEAQLHYAALDVVYLLDIYHELVQQLSSQGQLAWAQEYSQSLVHKLENTDHEKNYYTRIKSSWKLKPHQLSVLQLLCAWRENQARQKNMPRSWILKDSSLFDLASRLPSEKKHLHSIKEFSSKTQDKVGTTVLEIIQQGLNAKAHPPELPKPLTLQQRKIFKVLKSKVSEVAESKGMAAELLVRKKDFEFLARAATSPQTCTLPDSLSGWRQELIGNELLGVLANY